MNIDRRLMALLRGPRVAFGITVGLGILGGFLIVAQAALAAWMVNAVFLEKAALTDLRWAALAFVGVLAARAAARGGVSSTPKMRSAAATPPMPAWKRAPNCRSGK